MPEGPEVKSVAVSLNKKLENLYISNIIINEASRYIRDKSLENSLYSLEFPLQILKIYAKGKKILFECITKDNVKSYLVSALAM